MNRQNHYIFKFAYA